MNLDEYESIKTPEVTIPSSPPQLCMLCSVGYHLFCCHRSEKTSRRWMALDYSGVSIGILGCYVPGVFYTFYCNNVSPTAAHSHPYSCS